jgi:serine/threonine-protein kinase RsbW
MSCASGLDFRIPAQLAALEQTCASVTDWLQVRGIERDAFAVLLLLRESLNNAVLHGSDNDPTRTVRCRIRSRAGWLWIWVEDDGEGFDWQGRPRVQPAVTSCGSRGLVIYRAYATRIRFNQRGNGVCLSRKLTGGT